MEGIEILRFGAAVTTVIAPLLVAANWLARLTVVGFAVFIVGSIAWKIDGWLAAKTSLVIQNAILLLIGVYRRLPRAQD